MMQSFGTLVMFYINSNTRVHKDTDSSLHYKSDTRFYTESSTSASYLDVLLKIDAGGKLTSQFDPQAEGVPVYMRGPLSFSSYYCSIPCGTSKSVGRLLVIWQ
jgi:hypothetical protein